MEESKRRRFLVVIRSKGKKERERRVRNSIGARIPSKRSCFCMFLFVHNVLYLAVIKLHENPFSPRYFSKFLGFCLETA